MSLEEKIITILAKMAEYDLWKRHIGAVNTLLEIIGNKK